MPTANDSSRDPIPIFTLIKYITLALGYPLLRCHEELQNSIRTLVQNSYSTSRLYRDQWNNGKREKSRKQVK